MIDEKSLTKKVCFKKLGLIVLFSVFVLFYASSALSGTGFSGLIDDYVVDISKFGTDLGKYTSAAAVERISPSAEIVDNTFIDHLGNEFSCFNGEKYLSFEECVEFTNTDTGFLVEFATGEACTFDYSLDVKQKAEKDGRYKFDLGADANLTNMKCNVPFEFVGRDELATEQRITGYTEETGVDENGTEYVNNIPIYEEFSYHIYEPIYKVGDYYIDLDPSFYQDGSWSDNSSIYWQTTTDGENVTLDTQSVGTDWTYLNETYGVGSQLNTPRCIAYNGSAWFVGADKPASGNSWTLWDNNWNYITGGNSITGCGGPSVPSGAYILACDWNGTHWVITDGYNDNVCYINAGVSGTDSTVDYSGWESQLDGIALCPDGYIYATSISGEDYLYKLYPNGTEEGSSWNISAQGDNMGALGCTDDYIWVIDHHNGTAWVAMAYAYYYNGTYTGISKNFLDEHPERSGADFVPIGIEIRTDTNNFWTVTQINKSSFRYEQQYDEYYSVGNYTSQSFNASELVSWNNISWSDTLPSNTNITVEYRTSNDNINWIPWSGNISKGQGDLNGSSQYFQYRATFLTSDTSVTSYLEDVNITYNHAPDDPSPIINSTDGSNLTNQDLNCYFTPIDIDGDPLTCDVEWFNNSVSLFTFSGISCTNGTLFNHVLDSDNTTKDELWSCQARVYDGLDDSSLVNSTQLTVLNAPPDITFFNASNSTEVYENDADVSFPENEDENVTFAVEIDDPDDSDEHWYGWFLDSIVQPIFTSFFSWTFDFFDAGTYNVTVFVNDSDNAITSQFWNVDIANVVNRQWSVDYVSPTPADNENLTSTSVNISVEIKPAVLKESESKVFVDDAQGEFDFGSYENTIWNGSDFAVVLNSSMAEQQLFYDDFESGSLTTGGWQTSGPGNPWFIETFESYTGTYHAEAGNTDGESILSKSISTLNYQNVTLSFYWDTDLLDPGQGEYFLVDYYNGTGWTNVLFNDSNPAAYVLFNSTLGSDADNNSDFEIRFRCSSNLGTEECKIDGVGIKGRRKLFVADGTFTSQVFNASEDIVWDNISWSETLLGGTDLKFQVRSCDDASCSGEVFVGPGNNPGNYFSNPGFNDISFLLPNQYFQYKAFFETGDLSVSSKLFDVSINGHTIELIENVSVDSVWIDFDGANYTMNGSRYYWSYFNDSLDIGSFDYRVYANDSFNNLNFTKERTVIVPSYNITFNVTSGEDGNSVNSLDINITCNYSNFYQGGDVTNTYGPYEFPGGSWQCSFEDPAFFKKTIVFVADNEKTVDVVLEEEASLTTQEHDWLRDLYDCVINGQCTAYNYWQSTNETVEKIWKEYLPTDESVVANEEILNNQLSASNNISINYTINIPFKEGFDDQELLPLRIFFWFTDIDGNCFSQDKQTDSNRAEYPYCIPLLAEYLGPNNGTVSFKVDLNPDLPDGSYNITRSIDIDPPVNGKQVWINYGREIIGSISVINGFESAVIVPAEESVTEVVVEAKAPVLPSLNKITGDVVNSIKEKNNSALSILIGLAMICLTLISITYMRYR